MIRKTTVEALGMSFPPELWNAPRPGMSVFPVELAIIREMLRRRQPKSILEIGTCSGQTTFVLCSDFPNAKILTIDHVNVLPKPLPPNGKQIVTDSLLWRPDPSLYGTLDAIFIDACHQITHVAADTRLALLLARRGGLIIWHDFRHDLDVTADVWRIEPNNPNAWDIAYVLHKMPFKATAIERTSLAYYEVEK